MSKKPIITVDGPAGAGKSTACQALASKLGYQCLDSGAMYRALAYMVLKSGKDGYSQNLEEIAKPFQVKFIVTNGETRIFVGSNDVSNEIREPHIGMLASQLSIRKEVRDRLTELQREMGSQGGLVSEGRDIGTVVFPQAEVKFFLDSSLEERARRRHQELVTKGLRVTYSEVFDDISTRDQQDRNRELAPLKAASDAIVIDSTNLSPDEVVQAMYTIVQERCLESESNVVT
jgi:cytidylate kinase